MNNIGNKFINFIEKHKGGILQQTIVDYESGNETGKPQSPLDEIVPYFEENVLGYECTPEMRKAIKNAYNMNIKKIPQNRKDSKELRKSWVNFYVIANFFIDRLPPPFYFSILMRASTAITLFSSASRGLMSISLISRAKRRSVDSLTIISAYFCSLMPRCPRVPFSIL